MSVFEKHIDSLKAYEGASGVDLGRLLFAAAILSDCQESVGHDDDLFDELNDVKELIGAVVKQLEPLLSLWGCRETVRDGECEYSCEFLVNAGSQNEAEEKAWERVKFNYLNGEDDVGIMNENGWMELEGDYRWLKAEAVRRLPTVESLLQFVN